jgi:hypothetical protein
MIERVFRRVQHFFLTMLLRDKRGLPSLLFVPVGLLLLMGWVMKDSDSDISIALTRTRTAMA